MIEETNSNIFDFLLVDVFVLIGASTRAGWVGPSSGTRHTWRATTIRHIEKEGGTPYKVELHMAIFWHHSSSVDWACKVERTQRAHQIRTGSSLSPTQDQDHDMCLCLLFRSYTTKSNIGLAVQLKKPNLKMMTAWLNIYRKFFPKYSFRLNSILSC